VKAKKKRSTKKGAAKAAPSFFLALEASSLDADFRSPSRRSKSALADFDTFKLGRMG
jgi:hypothetical protein